MIAQISIGEGFGGLVNYANDIAKKDTVIIASEGVNLSSNVTIIASFKAQAKTRPSVHITIQGNVKLPQHRQEAGGSQRSRQRCNGQQCSRCTHFDNKTRYNQKW